MRILCSVLAIMLALLRPAFAVAALNAQQVWDTPKNLSFDIVRHDRKIGTHTVVFTRKGEDLQVDIDIRMAIKAGPLVVFKYTHHNTEIWRNQQLVSIETRTDDNNKPYTVSGKRVGNEFIVTSNRNGTIKMPADILPSSYWFPKIAGRTHLLNTQKGTMMQVNVAERPNATGKGEHFRLTGSDFEQIDVWYDSQNGYWQDLSFVARGTEISYQPVPSGVLP